MNHSDVDQIISREDMEKLKQLAVPIARWLALHGSLYGEVRVDSLGVSVRSLDAKSLFTPAEESEIFQE